MARWQMARLGISDNMIARRVRSGVLTARHRGVYAFGTPDRSYLGRCWAAVLAGGPGAVLGYISAAVIWGLRSGEPWPIHVIVPTRRRPHEGIRFHVESLRSDETVTMGGIPITTPVRTAFDLAGVLQPAELERVVNEIEARHLWSSYSLWDLLRRHPRRKGAGVLRRILEAGRIGSTRIHEGPEEEFLAFLDEHGLPRPSTNLPIQGVERAHEADFAWLDRLVNAEVDSGFHDTVRARENDALRDLDLEAAGWRVVRVRAGMLKREPMAVAARLRTILSP